MRTLYYKIRHAKASVFSATVLRRVVCAALCLCLLIPLIPGVGAVLALGATYANTKGPTSGVLKAVADPSTMDDFNNILDLEKDSRYAGRLWADKSVFADPSITLDLATDGVSATIQNASDFLHVFSALGSSQAFLGVPPTRTVIVFDNSGSMYNNNTTGNWDAQRIALTIESINMAIDSLMKASIYNQVSVVLFGDGPNSDADQYSVENGNTVPYEGNDTAVTIIPMGHYTPETDTGKMGLDKETNTYYTKYLDGGWAHGQDSMNGSKPNQTDHVSNGWVFVNHQYVNYEGHTSGYTAYRNGTTNIMAGYYVGMQELLNAPKTQKVGNETFDCVPALVMLTDGEATDSIYEWQVSADSNTKIEARGFINDFSEKHDSFTGVDSVDGACSWDQFVEEYTGADPKYKWTTIGGQAVESELNNHDKKRGPGTEAGNEALKSLADDFSSGKAYMILSTLLTAAYGKTAVTEAYNGNECNIYTISVDMKNPNGEGHTAQYLTSNGPTINPKDCFNEEWLSGVTGFDEMGKNNYADLHAYGSGTIAYQMKEGIQRALDWFEKWKNDEGQTDIHYRSILSGSSSFYNGNKDQIQFVNTAGGNHSNFWQVTLEDEHASIDALDMSAEKNPYGVTTAEVAANIKYNKEAYYVSTSGDGADGIRQVLSAITDDINRAVFTPVGGINDLGVENGITYMDPIGKYMETKSVDSIVVFGEQYKEMKAAVYDWSFNSTHAGENHDQPLYNEDGSTTGNTFSSGWYKVTTDEEGNEKVEYHPESYTGWDSGYDPWADGWTLYIDFSTARQFIPNIPENGNLDEEIQNKRRNTIYVIYRIDASKDIRDRLRLNPAYAGRKDMGGGDYIDVDDDYVMEKYPVGSTYTKGDETITIEQSTHLEQAWEAYLLKEKNVNVSDPDDDNYYNKVPGVYKLSDIRVWVEDTGDYIDPTVQDSGVMTSTGFDDALWINIPVAALPMRKVTIDYSGTAVSSDNMGLYSTNIGLKEKGHYQDLPVRVFYSVGIKNDIMSANGSFVELTKLSIGYLNNYKITTANLQTWDNTEIAGSGKRVSVGDVLFFSNWYSQTRYNGYSDSDTDYSYGDTVVSFSPDADNNYYIVQQPLPLFQCVYQYTGGEWKCVDGSADGFDASSFGGRYLTTLYHGTEYDDNVTSGEIDSWYDTAQETNPSLPDPQEGDVVFLEQDRMNTLNSEYQEGHGSKEFTSDGHYFMLLDYYVEVDQGGKKYASPFQYCVCRMGNEFGSGYNSSSINTGDMVCWTAMNPRSENINNGEKLTSMTFDYRPNDTNDATRGRPSFEKLTYKDEQLKTYLRDTCHYSEGEELEAAVAFWTAAQTALQEALIKADVSDDGQELTKDEYEAAFRWTLAAKHGGIRPGNMRQNIVPKKGDFNGDVETGYYDSNYTRTANNVLLPVISPDSAMENAAIEVNCYLGNNGRLVVSDSLFAVTKEVESMAGDMTPPDEKFGYIVTVKSTAINGGGFTGIQEAIVLNHTTNSGDSFGYSTQNAFCRMLNAVQLVTCNHYFLQYDDIFGHREVLVDDKGNIVTENADGTYTVSKKDINNPDSPPQEESITAENVYKLYIAGNGDGSHIRTLFTNAIVNGKLTSYTGSGFEMQPDTNNPHQCNYYGNNNMYLIPLTDTVPDQDGVTKFTPPEGGGALPAESGYEMLTLSNMQSSGLILASYEQFAGNGTAFNLSSEFEYEASYNTVPVYFGSEGSDGTNKPLEIPEGSNFVLPESWPWKDENGTPFEPPANTTYFELTHGTGLLFSSMPQGTEYTVTEVITKDNLDDGFDFKSVYHAQNMVNGSWQTVDYSYSDSEPHVNAHPGPAGGNTNTADFSKPNNYMVKHQTNRYETAVMYTNKWNNEKTETQINGEDVPNIPGETKPGVTVGDEITYNIKWVNDALDASGNATPAKVVITDTLDDGSDFVSASGDGVYYNTVAEVPDNLKQYVTKDRTVVWVIDAQAGETGDVTLTIKVNDKAKLYWDYDMDGLPDDEVDPNDFDYLVRNRATVWVNDNSHDTNVVQNPVGTPDKNEVKITGSDQTDQELTDEDFYNKDGADNTVVGPLVYVGDKITYEITWRNYENVPATITIRDPLDPNVKFISASFDPGATPEGYVGAQHATLTEGQTQSSETVTIPNPTDDDPNGTQTLNVITFTGKAAPDEEGNQFDEVVWNLGVQPAGAEGKVVLVVEVLGTATNVGYVDNTAYVKVNGDAEQQTKTVENPTPKVNKTESNPGNGEEVILGQHITYEISWDRKLEDAESTLSRITITDPLDPGVDFYSASYMGVTLERPDDYDGATSISTHSDDTVESGSGTAEHSITITYDPTTHTVTWILIGKDAATVTGSVSLTVVVNDKAVNGADNSNLQPPENIGETSDWNYRDDDALEEGDQLVQNRAAVQFNNDSALVTELMQNPLAETGSLTVKKVVTDTTPDTEKEFTFTVELTAPENGKIDLAVIKTEGATVTWTPESGIVDELTGTFVLRHDEYVTISGIPAGTTYEVRETERNGYNLKGITATFGNVNVDMNAEVASGVIEESSSNGMTFNNSKAALPPSTGGSGRFFIYLTGAVLLALAPIAYLGFRKRYIS